MIWIQVSLSVNLTSFSFSSSPVGCGLVFISQLQNANGFQVVLMILVVEFHYKTRLEIEKHPCEERSTLCRIKKSLDYYPSTRNICLREKRFHASEQFFYAATLNHRNVWGLHLKWVSFQIKYKGKWAHQLMQAKWRGENSPLWIQCLRLKTLNTD